MKVTHERATEVARLCNLRMSRLELERYADEMTAILDFFGQISAVPTDRVEPTAQTVPTACPLREDLPVDAGCQREILSAVPQTRNGQLLVPKIIE